MSKVYEQTLSEMAKDLIPELKDTAEYLKTKRSKPRSAYAVAEAIGLIESLIEVNDYLKLDRELLTALEEAGVDNWEGYSEATRVAWSRTTGGEQP